MNALGSCLSAAQKRLAAVGVDNPALDARLLIAAALEMDRVQLLTQNDRALTDEEEKKIETLITRRESREPVARILGLREFWGLPFGLNEATLEPRPDSETLVEAALGFFAQAGSSSPLAGEEAKTRTCASKRLVFAGEGSFPSEDLLLPKPPRRLLDLGTGTGCLLLSLLHEWPEATGLGIDLAPRATEQARENAGRLGLDSRAAFQTGNWLESLTEPFDLIISNPPYIPAMDIEALAPEVRQHDPRLALNGGADGLDPYRHLIPLLPNFLNPHGAVLFEVGIGQAEAVASLLKKTGFADIFIKPDLGGIDRCVGGFLRR